MEQALKKSLKVTVILVSLISAVLALAGKYSWAVGFLLGNLWSVANFLFILGLLKTLASKNKTKTVVMLFVKFPVLYLAGFFLFASRSFPAASLLAGLFPYLAATAIVKKCQPSTGR